MASTLSRARSNEPLIAIIGATGTGKSQLAVELAKRFNGEVINGDAMQLYAGLPVITNKITKSEQQGVPHYLIGTIGVQEPTWVVSTFVKKALAIITDIRSRGRLPILVGGTHYYTQSLLFREALADSTDQGQDDAHETDLVKQWPILAESTEVLLEELQKIDPAMAKRWHPKDRRKILRSLSIYLQTGKQASALYAEQQERKNGSGQSLMRFPSTLIFWVHAEQQALRARLEDRVDKMLDNGLLAEVQQLNDFLSEESRHGHTVDETRGIWVSIGFKEFKAYQELLQSGDAEAISQAKDEGVERTKISTRQYAKSQVRWIRLRLVKALREASSIDSLFLLNGTDISPFNKTVVEPAVLLTELFLNKQELPSPASLSPLAASMLDPDEADGPADFTVKHCKLCDVSCATEKQWDAHKKSKAHRKLQSKRRGQETGS